MSPSAVVFAVSVVLVLSLARADLDWWKKGPIYQVYPASFADSDGDGWGDLQGIIDHADYVKDIGVVAVWLSPIYPSPMRDNGYDVITYTDVNPRFGNLTTAENLIKTYHDKGMKVVLDFVPNHTSNDSAWFQDSVNRKNGKDDFYVWKDPSGTGPQGPIPPNNWRSTFGGSAWTYVPQRNQFYYHQFGDYQPDLNYNNTEVIKEMQDCVKFWLKKGVDGFRMDAVPFLTETNYSLNEPVICNPDNGSYACLDHVYTTNLPSTHKILEGFDAVLREKDFTSTGVRAMWVEAYNNITELMTYYGNVSFPFNFQYVSYFKMNSNAVDFQKLTMDYMNALNGRWPNNVVGNHDNSRVGTRMGADLIDSMNIIAQLLPGTSITYYGEELGMVDTFVPQSERRDFAAHPSRDPERTPMQWNTSVNAGFSTNNTLYLPVNVNYNTINTKLELTSSNTPSHLDVYKKAVKLHQQVIESSQDPFNCTTHGDWVFAARRTTLLIVTNFNNEEEKLSIKDLNLNKIPDSLTVALSSANANFSDGAKFHKTDNITLTPRSTVVFSFTNGASGVQLSSLLLFVVCFLLCWRY